MASQNGSEQYVPPEVSVGDCVLYHDNPTIHSDPRVGYICRRPGMFTVSILVFSPDQGWIEKPSVRHADDPGLETNPAWRQWGSWELHPTAALLKRLDGMMPQLTVLLARNGGKGRD